MEYGVVHSDLTDRDIKPRDLLEAYFKKVETDVMQYFRGSAQVSQCPACGSWSSEKAFEKFDFEYKTCGKCQTLFVSFVPSDEDLTRFYLESPARSYWLKEIWTKTSANRKTKVLEPLVEWVATRLEENIQGKKSYAIADIAASNPGFYEVATANSCFKNCALLEPRFPTSIKGETLSGSGQFDAVVLNDALGRVENPEAWLKAAGERLNQGGLCFITTVLSTGLDVLTLGAQSAATTPPDHLFLFSKEGLEALISKTPFEILEFSTPGVLDVQNLRSAALSQRIQLPPFFEYVFKIRQDSEFEGALQNLLQEYRLSSQARLVLKRK